MLETSLALESLIAGVVVCGSLAAATATLYLYRDVLARRPQVKLDDIIRDAPYDGLENVLKVAKS